MNKPHTKPEPAGQNAALPWLPSNQDPVHDDYSKRVQVLPGYTNWIPSGTPGLLLNVLEYSPVHERFTAVLKLKDDVQHAALCWHDALEVFVCHGILSWETLKFPHSSYLRIPNSAELATTDTQARPELLLHANVDSEHPFTSTEHEASLFVSGGQMSSSDGEERRIDTTESDRWLPGPVEGTEVLPLHVHGASNAMLVRWLAPVSFHPKLDPQGEEVFVLKGHLRDVDGTYPQGSWIRNPVASWQAWAGEPDTVIFYKSGHFLDCV